MENNNNQKQLQGKKKNQYIVVIGLSLILILATIIIVKQHLEKPREKFVPPKEALVSLPIIETNKDMQQKNASLENQLKDIQVKLQQVPSILTRKLVSVELMKAVLEGQIPLQTLRKFLETTNEPWSRVFLSQLGAAQSLKSYTELERMVHTSPVKKLIFWSGIKQKLNSFIHIRKVDQHGNYEVSQFDDIIKALREKDLKKAIGLYDFLSPKDKKALVEWKEAAILWMKIEEMRLNLLNELARS